MSHSCTLRRGEPFLRLPYLITFCFPYNNPSPQPTGKWSGYCLRQDNLGIGKTCRNKPERLCEQLTHLEGTMKGMELALRKRLRMTVMAVGWCLPWCGLARKPSRRSNGFEVGNFARSSSIWHFRRDCDIPKAIITLCATNQNPSASPGQVLRSCRSRFTCRDWMSSAKFRLHLRER